MADTLDDLEHVMGPDFGFGYDDKLGDPNVKPKVPPPPRELPQERTPESLVITFPEQQQFLEWLSVQLVAVKPSTNLDNPFANFSSSVAENRTYTCKEDPRTASRMLLNGLVPGTKYIARLVVNNPSGTVNGKPSEVLLTPPVAPEAPKVKAVMTKFDAQLHFTFPALGQNLTRLIVQCVEEGDGVVAFEDHERVIEAFVPSPQIATECVVERLRPGTRFIARLVCTNEAGMALGSVTEPVITHPRAHQLVEDVTRRTSTQVVFRFDDHGQSLTVLRMLCVRGKGKDFSNATAVDIPNPQTTTRCIVTKLEPNVLYSFRLYAENESGGQMGPICQVRTIEYSPELNDKSGWLYEMPDMSGRKTLGRRLSLRKTRPKRAFYVLDAKLLTWYDEPEGKELGFMHLGKVAEIAHEAGTSEFVMHLKTGKQRHFNVESVDPNVTSEALCTSWVGSLRGAIEGRPSATMSRQDSTTSGGGRSSRNGTTAPAPAASTTSPATATASQPAPPAADSSAPNESSSLPAQEVFEEEDDESFGF
ncbi:hypothetical protein PTSG_08062 [Salpingoeca rosetta]|uniref:Fibronectin type-III domain-containing protein n=1 Tax=Salpingoeca rosetta (strain ATCC 50818 / BSB-021) TaxID=946362 RepID=F2UHW2_SALR5|nr:uncharacterized protein PTSG_08062 [Salpingoeca rosetta]EGD76711.1 hypothetical protein PTSG_08062 [Salpingoeca rosetta]|eukprot:XP_004991083.1 hypothetical protein PTSG_08062 [Salpingoeca rosetta]